MSERAPRSWPATNPMRPSRCALLLCFGVLACAGRDRASQVNAGSPDARQEDPRASAASPEQSGEPPAKVSEASADATSEPTEQPCADAHKAPGGCKGGFIVSERNLCFVLVESACRCKCNGMFESCRAPKVDPNALPGPVAPEVVCAR